MKRRTIFGDNLHLFSVLWVTRGLFLTPQFNSWKPLLIIINIFNHRYSHGSLLFRVVCVEFLAFLRGISYFYASFCDMSIHEASRQILMTKILIDL